jgi:hypothetical protein
MDNLQIANTFPLLMMEIEINRKIVRNLWLLGIEQCQNSVPAVLHQLVFYSGCVLSLLCSLTTLF